MSDNDPNFWWSELNHGGMFLSPAILKEFLPDGPAGVTPDSFFYRKFRDAYAAFDSWSLKENEKNHEGLFRWIDYVFEEFLEYPSMLWQKGNNVNDRFKYQSSNERLRPNRVLLDKGIGDNHRFLIKIDTRKGRLGMGKGRIEYSKFLTLLRGTKVQFGVFTNGYQFRLVYAGMDYDCWVEWDAARWFEEESGLDLLAGFKALCGRYATFKTEEDEFPLRSAVVNSRTRQGELSQVLGEQVRIAVEKVLSSFDKAARTHSDMLDPLRVDPVSKNEIGDSDLLNALYIAAIRVIMRMVVVLFAESRDLLPRNMEKYHSSYGIEGLFASLEEAVRYEGEENLKSRFSAWPRLFGLFLAAYEGCSNEDIPIPRYSGSLFKKGDSNSSDLVLRALSVLEDERWEISDFVVLEILRLLKIGKVRARRGRSSTWVSGPVDFSDLRTEYIGMMYEGLLDYELKQVTKDQGAILFLNLGQQPALPLSLLENLSDNDLKNLIDKLRKGKTTEISAKDEDADEEDEEVVEEVESSADVVEKISDESSEDVLNSKVINWAERAVDVANIVKMPKDKKSDRYAYELERSKAAKDLVLNVFGPDEMYIVRWSGTRKGTGTFYTRPQLAVPTVHRTLEPLVYDKNNDELTPKTPEKILSLKVVDPAMGSGSFLVAALRYLTDVLYESLLHHKKIHERGSGGCVITLPFGEESSGSIKEELLPIRPDDERFEQILKTRLKRHVVERCIYGVDINNLAVELARLSLWIETMDRELPFEFLAHKLKVGNSIVGCWLDRFQDYPVLAWEREGGDGSQGEITKKIKSIYNNQVKPEMKKWIIQMSPQRKLSSWTSKEESIDKVQDENVNYYSKLHESKGFEREELFRTNIQNNENLKKLNYAMDKWCAVWFWPVYDENNPILSPDRFYQPNGSKNITIEKLSNEIKFFHWEIEFPDVFTIKRNGFDAILGNPPWETLEPNSQEFFTRIDPIYRTYGKQDAIAIQKRLFETNPGIKIDWDFYNAYFKAISNWIKHSSKPFDGNLSKGNENVKLKNEWHSIRKQRYSICKPPYPYIYQGGGKPYTYKMFLENSFYLLRNGGRIGFIVPSNIYSDQGSQALRTKFIEENKWEWLFGFENRKGIFNIHRSFKFCPIIIEKGSKTTFINTAFMKRDLNEWESPQEIVKYDKDTADIFSPKSKSILEISTQNDMEILLKIFQSSTILGSDEKGAWNIKYTQGDFNMTSDSKLFPPLIKWEEIGFKPNSYGQWIKNEEGVALPIYEGRMIGQYDFSEKKWISGKGRGAVWETIPFDKKEFGPQYLISEADYKKNSKYYGKTKAVMIGITSATNKRSMICTPVPRYPCTHVVPFLSSKNKESLPKILRLSSFLNSFVYDYSLRARLGGGVMFMCWHILEETPLVKLTDIPKNILRNITILPACLTYIHKLFAPEWLILNSIYPSLCKENWKKYMAVTEHERIRIRCILEALISNIYGLEYEELSWILKDCKHPINKINNNDFSSKLDPKGFWRVDKGKPPELRQTTLALQAFKRLKEVGFDSFCKEDWQFSKDIQDKLGPRFLPWQLEGTPEESWKECEQHAKNTLGEDYEKFIEQLYEKNSDSDKNGNNSIQYKGNFNKQKSILQWRE